MSELKRVCKECNEPKPITDFRLYQSSKQHQSNWYSHYCTRCLSLREKRSYHSDIAKRASVIIANKKYRCKKLGIPYDLDKQWYLDKVNAGHCEATGLPLNIDTTDELGYHTPFAPSIDRIDKDGGYLKSNCRVVCNIFNVAKNAYSDEDVYLMSKAYVERYEQKLKRAA